MIKDKTDMYECLANFYVLLSNFQMQYITLPLQFIQYYVKQFFFFFLNLIGQNALDLIPYFFFYSNNI